MLFALLFQSTDSRIAIFYSTYYDLHRLRKMMTIISIIHFVAYSFCSLCMIGCQWHHSIRKYPGTPRDIEPKSKLNISVYLKQHTPLQRSKFRIKIKKTRTKIGTLRISHASSKLHGDMRSRSFDNKDQLEENRSYYRQDLGTEWSIQV